MKTTKIIIFSLTISLIIILIMMLLPKSVFAVKGSVTVDGVRIRKEPSTDSTILTDVYKTDTIDVLEKTGDWYKVTFGEYTGYMSAAYVLVSGDVPVSDNTTDTNTTNSNNESTNNTNTENTVEGGKENPEEEKKEPSEPVTEVAVYVLPVLYSNKVDKITLSSEAEEIKSINNWTYVKYGEKEGWVIKSLFDSLVAPEEENEPVEDTESEGNTESNNTETSPVTDKKGYINVSSAIVRKEANLEGEILLGLSRNTEVTIVEEGTEWLKIKTDEVEGYVAKRLISDQPTETTSRSLTEQRALIVTTYYVSVSSANIREEASVSSAKIGSVSRKAEIESIGEEEGFYKIKYNDGYGYISKDLVVDSLDKVVEPVIETTSNASSSSGGNYNPPASGSGQAIVDYAMQFVGCKYVYAGSTPSGFDCSGFTYYIYNNCGYSVGRTISAQRSKGQEVSRGNLQAGDLVIFNDSSNSSIGHVGIYISGGSFVHAANPSRGVVTDTMNSGYYDVRYVGAVRF